MLKHVHSDSCMITKGQH